MIKSVDEFMELSNSDDFHRFRTEEVPTDVLMDTLEQYPQMKLRVAQYRRLPNELLRILAQDPDPDVRLAIAQKYPLDDDIYLLLSKDPDETVRHYLAFNKRIPLPILKDMAESDESDFVRQPAREKYQARLRRETERRDKQERKDRQLSIQKLADDLDAMYGPAGPSGVDKAMAELTRTVILDNEAANRAPKTS